MPTISASLIIKISLVIVILSVIGFFIYDYRMSKAQLEAKKAELIAVSEQIKSQNEAIEKLKIDGDFYKNQKPKVVEKIVTRYQEVEVLKPDATCEERIAKLEEYVKVFYNRNAGTNYLTPKNGTGETTENAENAAIPGAEKTIEHLEEQNLKAAQDYVDKMLKRNGSNGGK